MWKSGTPNQTQTDQKERKRDGIKPQKSAIPKLVLHVQRRKSLKKKMEDDSVKVKS